MSNSWSGWIGALNVIGPGSIYFKQLRLGDTIGAEAEMIVHGGATLSGEIQFAQTSQNIRFRSRSASAAIAVTPFTTLNVTGWDGGNVIDFSDQTLVIPNGAAFMYDNVFLANVIVNGPGVLWMAGYQRVTVLMGVPPPVLWGPPPGKTAQFVTPPGPLPNLVRWYGTVIWNTLGGPITVLNPIRSYPGSTMRIDGPNPVVFNGGTLESSVISTDPNG